MIDTVNIEYSDLPIEVITGYKHYKDTPDEPIYEKEETSYIYKASVDDVIDALFSVGVELPEFIYDEGEEVDKWVEENLQKLVNENIEILQDYFEEEAIEKAQDAYDSGIIDIRESCNRGKKMELTEKKWQQQLPEEIASKLRKAINKGNYRSVKEALKDAWKAISSMGLLDGDELEETINDIDALDESEDEIDFALSEFYDFCDNLSIWIPIDNSFDDEDEEEMEFDEVEDTYDDDEWDDLYDEIYGEEGIELTDVKESLDFEDRDNLTHKIYQAVAKTLRGVRLSTKDLNSILDEVSVRLEDGDDIDFVEDDIEESYGRDASGAKDYIADAKAYIDEGRYPTAIDSLNNAIKILNNIDVDEDEYTDESLDEDTDKNIQDLNNLGVGETLTVEVTHNNPLPEKIKYLKIQRKDDGYYKIWNEDNDGGILNEVNYSTLENALYWLKRALGESLDEDVVKQDDYWVNKGKEGTHGKFKTKKQADAQRKAMFANGFKEELKKEESLNDEKDWAEFSTAVNGANPKFDRKKYGKYFDKEGKLIKGTEKEYWKGFAKELKKAEVDDKETDDDFSLGKVSESFLATFKEPVQPLKVESANQNEISTAIDESLDYDDAVTDIELV